MILYMIYLYFSDVLIGFWTTACFYLLFSYSFLFFVIHQKKNLYKFECDLETTEFQSWANKRKVKN